jgi:RNA polymerase sigma factor (sigma-70 family)
MLRFSAVDAPEASPVLVGQLAGEHAEHVRYLRRHFQAAFHPDELDELVREAYVRALASIEASAPGDLQFESFDKARGWFRQIAKRTAIDAVRARDGRRESEKRLRPQVLSLDRFAADQERDDAADNPALRDPDADTEEDGLLWSERDHAQHVLTAALDRVRPELLRLLRARYLDNLEPDAIQRREGLSPTQYERQHTRALKAMRKALGGLELGESCTQVRLQLRHDTASLLDRHAVLRRDAHLAGCRPCQLVSLQLRGALAALPAPVGGFGVLAKLAGLFSRESAGSAVGGAAASSSGAAKGAGVLGAATAAKSAVTACAVTAAVCGTFGLTRGTEPPARNHGAPPDPPVVATRDARPVGRQQPGGARLPAPRATKSALPRAAKTARRRPAAAPREQARSPAPAAPRTPVAAGAAPSAGEEFSPESFVAESPPAPARTRTATSSSSGPPAVAPAAVPKATPSPDASSSSGEFSSEFTP